MQEQQLKAGLKQRHLTMIAIAGSIGGALFIGSGKLIASAGPAAFLAFLGGAILVFLIMRMLGEMAVANPDTGSFSTYADRAVGEWLGFTIGWLYWSFWSMLLGWESYVAGVILHNWFPMIPIWVYMLIISIALLMVNLMDVRNYGEFEFWFASVKITAIVLFILVGSLALINLWPFGEASGFSNLTKQGFMPNGFSPVVVALLGAMFGFIGAEIVTIAATESKNPSEVIKKAVRSAAWRLGIFYVVSIFIVVCLIPYNDPGLALASEGTYTVAFKGLGIPYAQTIVNIIVLTSVLSCFNSALYTSSRMIYSLAKRKDAPKIFTNLSQKNSVPNAGVYVSSIFGFIAAYLTATDKMNIYDVLMQTNGAIALYVYLCIALSQLNMRKKLERENKEIKFKMWLFPYLTYATIIFIISALVIMVFEGTYRNEVLYTAGLAIIIAIIGLLKSKKS